jgi:hypothetical protein
MPEAEIVALENDFGMPLPAELRAMLQLCSGIDCPNPEEFDVSLNAGGMYDAGAFLPVSVTLARDVAGNFFAADLSQKPTDSAPVYFLCHDPPVVMLAARTVTDFIELAITPNAVFPDAGLIWSTNPGVLSHAEATAGDETMRKFAADLDDTWLFVDLRNAAVGDGFSWGRYGAETENRRAGAEPIFAYQKRKLSWFQRLFGV